MRFFILIAIVFIQLLPVHADAQTVTDKFRDFTDAGGYDDAILREARRVDGYRETGDFIPLVGIPFIDETGVRSGGLAAYANSLYRVAITIAAVLAVIKIVIAGVQYMLTDVVTQKSQAKKSIRTALLGLLLVVGAVLILNTVNPSLTNLEVLNLQQLSGEISTITIETDVTEAEFGDKINNCEASTKTINYFKKSCPGDIVATRSDKFVGCTVLECVNTFPSTGPTSCPDGEKLVSVTTETGIENSCEKMPDTDEDETTTTFTKPCASVKSACQNIAAAGFRSSIQQMQEECDGLGGSLDIIGFEAGISITGVCTHPK